MGRGAYRDKQKQIEREEQRDRGSNGEIEGREEELLGQILSGG